MSRRTSPPSNPRDLVVAALISAALLAGGHAAAEDVTATITLPGEAPVCRIAVFGRERLGLGHGTVVNGAGAARSAIVGSGALGAELGTEASVGLSAQQETFDVLSKGSVTIRPHARVTGSVRAGGSVDVHSSAQVLGGAEPGFTFGPETSLTIDLKFPPVSPGLLLNPHQVADLAPGSYDELRLLPWSRVRLESGRYYFERLRVSPNATMEVTAESGLTTLFVRTELDFKGQIALAQGPETFFVGYLGSAPARLAGQFDGTLMAPDGKLDLSAGIGPGHRGSFLGKQVDVSPNSSLGHVPFMGWAELLGAAATPPTLEQARLLPPSCAAPHLCCTPQANLSGYGGEDDRHDITQAGECVFTGGGNDTVSGVQPDAVVVAGPGADVLHLGQGGAAYGGEGDDAIDTLGNSIVYGNGGHDTILIPCGSGIVFPGPGRDTVELGPGDDIVVINDACELSPGEKLIGGGGHDVLVTPLTLHELELAGVEVDGFEEVKIERHPCQSECRNAPTCSGVGNCIEDPVTLQLSCDCPAIAQGANCELPNAPAFVASPPPSLGNVAAGQEPQAARDFLDWFGKSRVGDSPAARGELDAAFPNVRLRRAFVDLAADLIERPRTEAGMAAVEVLGYLRCARCEVLLGGVIAKPVPATGPVVEGEHGGSIGSSDAFHVTSLHLAAVTALAYQRTPTSRQFLLDVISNHPHAGTRLAAVHALIATHGTSIRPDVLARLPAEQHLEAFRVPNGAPDFSARLLEFTNAATGN